MRCTRRRAAGTQFHPLQLEAESGMRRHDSTRSRGTHTSPECEDKRRCVSDASCESWPRGTLPSPCPHYPHCCWCPSHCDSFLIASSIVLQIPMACSEIFTLLRVHLHFCFCFVCADLEGSSLLSPLLVVCLCEIDYYFVCVCFPQSCCFLFVWFSPCSW